MSDKFEQWFESEFPDADLSQRETLKGYNNLKYGWNAALSSLQGEQEARIKELESELAEQSRLLGISAERELALQAKLAEVEKDAERYRWMREGNAMEPEDNGIYGYERLDEFCDTAIQESKKGGAV